MVSTYLKQPLRTLEQALEDRTRVRAPTTQSVQADDPVALLLHLLSSDGQAGAPGDVNADTANRPPLDRRHAA